MQFAKPYFFSLLFALFLWACTDTVNPIEHPMDHPAIQKILFHPRSIARNSPPQGATDIDIEVEPGVTLGCRLFTADPQAPTLLFFHGNGEIVSDYDTIGPLYVEQGMNFLVTDYRGYGWSTGSPSYSTFLPDCHKVYDKALLYLQEQGYSSKLFLMGRSLGSACALELAFTHNEAMSGLIIDSGFAQTLPLAQTLGADITGIQEEETFNNAWKIRSVTKPTLLLHGQQDTLIPLWQAEQLHAESGARTKELQIVPGADHNSLIARGGMQYFLVIRRFVDQITGASDWRTRRKAHRQAQD